MVCEWSCLVVFGGGLVVVWLCVFLGLFGCLGWFFAFAVDDAGLSRHLWCDNWCSGGVLWWCVLIVYCGFRRWRNRVVTPPVESFSLRKEGLGLSRRFRGIKATPNSYSLPQKKTPGARNVFCSFSSVLHSQTQRRSQCSACCFPLSAPADPNTFFFLPHPMSHPSIPLSSLYFIHSFVLDTTRVTPYL